MRSAERTGMRRIRTVLPGPLTWRWRPAVLRLAAQAVTAAAQFPEFCYYATFAVTRSQAEEPARAAARGTKSADAEIVVYQGSSRLASRGRVPAHRADCTPRPARSRTSQLRTHTATDRHVLSDRLSCGRCTTLPRPASCRTPAPSSPCLCTAVPVPSCRRGGSTPGRLDLFGRRLPLRLARRPCRRRRGSGGA